MKKLLLIIYSVAVLLTLGFVLVWIFPNLIKEDNSGQRELETKIDFVEEKTTSFEYDIQPIEEESTFRVTFSIPEEYLGLDLVLSFDPNLLQIEEATEGNMFKKHIHRFDNAKGFIVLSGAGQVTELVENEYFYDVKIVGVEVSKESFELVERSPFTDVYSNYLNTEDEIVLIKE